jgi:hypothetical protein
LEKDQTSQFIFLPINKISNTTRAIVLAIAISVNFFPALPQRRTGTGRLKKPEKDNRFLFVTQLFKDFLALWQESL